jgi:hypothetical protein
MTALRYNKPMMSGLRKAGRLFGLDLASLFDDDGEATSGDFAPALQFQTTAKGRGQALYLRPQQQSAVTTTLNLIPRGQQLVAPSEIEPPSLPTTPTTPEVEEETPEVEEQRKALRDIASEYGATALFGHQDYKKATQEYGYDPSEIRAYLEENPYMLASVNRPGQAGGLFEEIAGGKVDLSKATTREYANRAAAFQPAEGQGSDIQAFKTAEDYAGSPQISTKFGQSAQYFGGEDLKAARMSGYDDAAIKSFLEKNLELVRGPNVPGGSSEIGQMLAEYKPQQTSTGGFQNTVNDVDRGAAAIGTGAGASAQYFGHADVEKAKAGGASNEQIAAYIKNNPGLLRGGNVAGGGGLYDEFKRYM